jgi:hypothetical protein
MIHEYLHTITHENYEKFARSIDRSKGDVLIEGGTSLFTDKVWNTIFPDEIRANAPLRLAVEGSAQPFDAAAIPAITHYNQIAQARDIEAAVGEANMRDAYFLGHVELLGLGPSWKPALVGKGEIFKVRAGMTTLADVAGACNVPEADVAAANGKVVGAPVKTDDELKVPGIRMYVVNAGDTQAKVADLNGTTTTALIKANPGFPWTAMKAGQTVVIPAH